MSNNGDVQDQSSLYKLELDAKYTLYTLNLNKTYALNLYKTETFFPGNPRRNETYN